MSQNILYYSNENNIMLIDTREIINNARPGQEQEFIPQTNQHINMPIRGPCRLLKMFETTISKSENYIFCSVETDDNQIDTVRLYFWSLDFQKADLEFYQYREVVRRNNVSNDPIKTFKQVIIKQVTDGVEDEWGYSVAHRISGKIDLYWNFQLTSSPEESYMDVELTFKHFHLKRQQNSGDLGQDPIYKQYRVALIHKQRIGPDVAELQNFKNEKWSIHFYDLIRYYVKIYTKITLVNTNFFVAFNKVVSIYDIVKKEWKFHFFFDHDVIEVLKNQRKPKSKDVNVAAYLENGDLKIIDATDIHGDNWELKDQTFKIEGEVETIVSDWRDISSHYILTRLQNGQRRFTGFQCSMIQDLNSVAKFKEEDELIRFVSPDVYEDFVLLNKKTKEIRSYTNHEQLDGMMFISESRKFKLNEPEKIEGKLHTMVASHNSAQMLLFDDKNIYVISTEDGTIQVKPSMNVQSLQVLDVDYCYSLSNESSVQPNPGFYIQNINAFIDNTTTSTNFKLKGAMVGVNDLLDFYQEDQRIAYMSSYSSIKIVPVLHRCAIGFIGMKPRHKYLAFKKIKDKLIALDKKGFLTTWSIITGKILQHQHVQRGFDLGSYQIYGYTESDITYKASWNQPRVLLVDKDHPVQVDENEYYGDRLKTALENNTPYIKIEKKIFVKYRMIEILNQSEVEEHFSFIHPYYNGDYQRIYFSDDLSYMLERQNQRVFFYRRIETLIPGEIKWFLVRRIKQFPTDLSECTFVNYLFSPNLQFYLDYDKDDNIFLIKKTEDQSTYKVIPQSLMNPSKEPVHAIGKKFRWLDNQKIRILNVEGFEKIIDLNTMEELAYCSVPNFDNKYLLDNPNSHFYYDTSVTSENQTIERLRRKYQEYYSALQSDGMRTPDELYEILFKVDYNIDGCKGKLVADLSFTFFHWKLAEMMKSSNHFSIKKYHIDEIKALSLNIFPGCNTVLHYAYKHLYLVRRFYKVIEQEYLKNLESEKENGDPSNVKQFEIPFIQNFDGKTPIHLCLENENFKSADIILSKLCNESIDSHSRSISDILPQIIEAELPCAGPYLNSRIIQTLQLKEFRRGAINFIDGKEYALGAAQLWAEDEIIKKKFFTQSKIDSEVVLQMLDVPAVHSYQEKVGDDFFDALANCENINIFNFKSIQYIIDHKWPLAKEYTIKILFIPFLFYLALFGIYSNCFNQQYAFYKRPGMYEVDCILSALLYCFSIYFLQNEVRQIIMGPFDYFKSIWNYCDFVPPCFIIIIVSMHLKRNLLPEDGTNSPPNATELQADIDIAYQPDQTLTDYQPNRGNVFDNAGLTCIHAIASLMMWFKLIYFLRIFESTGYLVRMLTEVISAMKVFLLMLGIVLIAFGEAFLRFSEVSGEDVENGGSAFIVNYPDSFVYAFRLAVGDTLTDTFNSTVQPVVLWIIWCLCLLLTNVVMLNLLIAIISEAFNDINEAADQANYQERARIISENSYLIPKWKKQQFGGRNQYLVIAREKTETEDAKADPITDVQEKVKELSLDISRLKKLVQGQNVEVLDRLSEIRKDINLKK